MKNAGGRIVILSTVLGKSIPETKRRGKSELMYVTLLKAFLLVIKNKYTTTAALSLRAYRFAPRWLLQNVLVANSAIKTLWLHPADSDK